MRYISEALMWLSLLVLILLCVGEPDILDGLIKRANNVACESK